MDNSLGVAIMKLTQLLNGQLCGTGTSAYDQYDFSDYGHRGRDLRSYDWQSSNRILHGLFTAAGILPCPEVLKSSPGLQFSPEFQALI
jgi:hypothetical protein